MRKQSPGALAVVAVTASASCCLFTFSEAFVPAHQKLPFTSATLTGSPMDSTRLAETKETATESNDKDSIGIGSHIKPELKEPTNSNVNGLTDEEEYGVLTAQKRRSPLPGAERVEQFLSEPLVEITEAYLVILSSALVAIATLPLNTSWQATIEDWQEAIAYTFVLGFVARWYSSWSEKGLFRYLSQPLVLVDVLVVILPVVLPVIAGMPPWLSSQQGLINLRLLRILRLQRVLKDLDTFSSFSAALGLGDVRQVQLYQLQLARVILSLFTLLSVSSGLIYAAEHGVNPDMENYFSALYFSLTTLTTVGFGDITPVTFQGKLVVSASILAGVTVIPAQAGKLVESLMNAQSEREPEQTTRGASVTVSDQSIARSHNKLVVGDEHRVDSEAKDELVPEESNRTLPSSAVDAVTPCPTCGATFHWTSARYCWSCGGALSKE